jgi:hypothetical protein
MRLYEDMQVALQPTRCCEHNTLTVEFNTSRSLNLIKKKT